MVDLSDLYDLCAYCDDGVHQLAVGVIENVLEFDAIGVLELHCFIKGFVFVGKDSELELSGLHLGFVEHPFVEKQVVITGCRCYEGDGAALWARYGLASFIDGLPEVVGAFCHVVNLRAAFNGQFCLYCHAIVFLLLFYLDVGNLMVFVVSLELDEIVLVGVKRSDG